MKNITQQIKQEAKLLGADIVGIANIERWENAPYKLTPKAHLPEAKSVIVMGIHHPDASVEWGGLPNSNYAGPFQIGMIPKLDTMARRLAYFINEMGETAVPYPCTGFWRHRPYKEIESTNTASFSHRHAAVAAGLGEFGHNNMFMSPEYGPRQRLISVITTLKLTPDSLFEGKLCDNCNMCVKHCPGNNFAKEHLLSPGVDIVKIEDKEYKYAKLNRWRCLWGEQFAMDMSQLKDYNIKIEDDLYKAVDDNVPRLGGEFGSCFRYCMGQNKRYFDRKYSTAPRRKKEVVNTDTNNLISKIKEIAIQNSIDRIDIRKLDVFDKTKMKLSEGYPIDDMKKNFTWVISMAKKIPRYSVGLSILEDNQDYIKAVIKVRLSIVAYEISSYLDNLGYEAMQDWMSLGDQIKSFYDIQDIEAVDVYPIDDEIDMPRAEKYKLAALDVIGVQREQQSMTAGQQGQQDALEQVISCSVICKAPLVDFEATFKAEEVEIDFDNIEKLNNYKYIDKIGVVNLDDIEGIDNMIDFKRIMPTAKSVIVLLAGIDKRISNLANNQDAECATSYSYLNYQILRELLWSAHDLSDSLTEKSYKSLPFADVAKLSYRTAAPYWEFSWAKLGHPDTRANSPLAASAGLGEMGKNGMLLTPEFGPHQKFVFILSEAPYKSNGMYDGEKLCVNCNACVNSCPISALNKNISKDITLQNDYHCSIYHRDEQKCEWARSLAMIDEEGSKTIGWKKPDIEMPKETTIDEAKKALLKKDPLQVKAYLYPCQIETIIPPCAQNCRASKINDKKETVK